MAKISNKRFLLDAALKLAGRFTSANEQVIGVDITSDFVRVAQLVKKEDAWSLTLLDEEAVVNSGNATGAVNDAHVEALRELIRRNNIQAKSAAISVPVTDAIVRVLTVPLMSENEISSAIEYDSLWRNVVNLNVDLSEYAIFYQIIHRDPSTNTMKLLFVASRNSDIEHYAKIVRSAGLEPVVVDVECFAIRNAFDLHKKVDAENQIDVIVEFGVRGNYVLIIDKGAPFITDLFLRDEDKIKLADGKFSEIERDQFFSRFAMQINQILASHEEHYKTPAIRTIYLVSDLKTIDIGIQDLSKALYNRNIIFFDPLGNPELVKISGGGGIIVDHKNRSSLSAVLGLATRSLDVFGYYKYVVGVKNVNLLPNREKLRVKKKGDIVVKMMVVSSIALYAVIFLLSLGSLYFEREGLRQATRSFQMVESELHDKTEALAALMAEGKSIKETIALGSGLLTNQRQLSEIMRGLGSYMPDGAWIHSVQFKEGSGLLVTGFARTDQDVLMIVNRLSVNSQINSAELDAVELKTTDSGFRKFEMKAFRIKAEVAEKYVVPKSHAEGKN